MKNNLVIFVFASILCSFAHAGISYSSNTKFAKNVKPSFTTTGHHASAARVTALVTTVADYNDHKHIRHSNKNGHAEVELDADPLGHEAWSAYAEVDYQHKDKLMTRKMLIDVGSKADILLKNAKMLKIDLSEVTDVFLTHWHYDHVQALSDLVSSLAPQVTVHVQEEAFKERKVKEKTLRYLLTEYEELKNNKKVTFMVYNQKSPMFFRSGNVFFNIGGVMTTGEVPRRFFGDEQSYPQKIKMADTGETDTVKDDQSLVINTLKGPVVVTGCSHAGVRNILAYVKEITGSKNIHAVIGGLHFFGKKLAQGANSIKTIAKDLVSKIKVDFIMAGHCSGTYRAFYLGKYMKTSCERSALASVGSQFLTTAQPVGDTSKAAHIVGGQFTSCPIKHIESESSVH